MFLLYIKIKSPFLSIVGCCPTVPPHHGFGDVEGVPIVYLGFSSNTIRLVSFFPNLYPILTSLQPEGCEPLHQVVVGCFFFLATAVGFFHCRHLRNESTNYSIGLLSDVRGL